MKEAMYTRMTSYTAIFAGLSALAYAYFFIVAKDVTMYSLFLLLLGLSSLEVFVALFGRLRAVHEDLARIAMALGVVGAAGAAIHGGYDLAIAINPPVVANADLPSQVDPRGLLTFGFMGIATFKMAWLLAKDKYFPTNLAWVGYASGVLLVVIYVARLTVLDPTNPVLLYPVLLNGFVLSPLWYLWLGYSWLKTKG